MTAARNWLNKSGLTPTDIDAGRVSRPLTGQTWVTFHPQATGALIPQEPMIQVKLLGDGTIQEVAYRWPKTLQTEAATLRSVDAAWQEVVAGGGYLEAFQTIPADLPPNTVFKGLAAMTRVSLGWGPASDGQQQYLVPLYVFEGSATLDNQPTGQPATIPVRVYIAATNTR